MNASDSYKKAVARAVSDILSPRGFQKKALVFSRALPEVVHFVGLQASTFSTAEGVRITVNLGVLVPGFCEPGEPISIWSSQWRCRLGELFPGPCDKWWSITSESEVSMAEEDIVARIATFGLPELEKLKTKEDLAGLWRSGKSPGLTDFQRRQHLKSLSNVA